MDPAQPNRHHRPGRLTLPVALALALAVAAAMAVAVAACGSAGTQLTGGGATTATGNASPVNLSRCMRAHGASNFPDPVNSQGGEGFPRGLLLEGDGSMVVDGVTLSGPALKSAEKACSQYLGPKGPPPKLTASQRQAALRFAHCMRTHGVPSFPDPTFSAGGPVATGPGTGVDPQSPAFQAAVKACSGGRNRVIVG